MTLEFHLPILIFLLLFIVGVAGVLLSLRCREKVRPSEKKSISSPEAGNVFFAIFGAVAVLGILGASVMTFMKGPLATSVKITRQNVAENQMLIGAQVAVMAAASQANNGDCDADTVIEPVAWRDPAALPHPTNGGLIPLTIGISKKDPWGTDYGYCVWDHGSVRGSAGCGSGTGMLAGTTVGSSYPVVAIVSAGPDKAFNSTCRTFATADSNGDGDLLDAGDTQLVEKTTGSDDVIFTYTYEEATSASGGLWSLKSGSPNTATINKDIEVSGTGKFDRLGSTGSDYLEVLSGMKFANPSSMPVCNAANLGVVRMNASNNGLQMCDGISAWNPISGSGAAGAFETNNLPCDGTTVGKVRYNSSTAGPEYCNGTQWLPFSINIPGVNLVLSPTSNNSMNVNGTANVNPSIVGLCDDGNYFCGNEVTFTLTNSGTVISANIALSLTNTTNFYLKSQTCTVAGGNTDGKLSPNEACTIKIIPKANGNLTYTSNLQISANNNPFAILQGTSINFGCFSGRSGAGGIYAACGLSDPDGSYNLVIMPGGCSGAVVNPSCTGGNDSGAVARPYGLAGIQPPNVVANTGAWGARQHQNLMAYFAMTAASMPAAQYCNDMVYNGFSDWFLPSRTEWDYVQTAFNSGRISFVYGAYKLSDITEYYGYTNHSQEWVSNPGSPYYRGDWRNNSQYVRCVRRDNLPLPAAVSDTTPDKVPLIPKVVFSAGGPATSNTVTVSGIMQPIAVTMTGGTNMDIIRNGVSTGLTTIPAVNVTDTLAFRMDAPSTIGTKNNATVTIGTLTIPWWVGYADQTKEIKAFSTSTTYRAAYDLGGLGGGDTRCNQRAAASPYGLSGSYRMLASNSTIDAADRIPWNWGVMKTLTGTVVVNGGLSDLFDGTLMNPINVTELGTTNTNFAWTGSGTTGTRNPNSGNVCADYAGYSDRTTIGNTGATGSTWIAQQEQYCDYSYVLYCVENIDDTTDTTPNVFYPKYKLQVPINTRIQSDASVINGMSTGVTGTMSISAPSGNPAFTINGGAEVTSGTIRNGDQVIFLMDSAATASTSRMMTITLPGGATVKWRIWTGDPTGTRVRRVFVTSTDPNGASFGGVSGADPVCQARATAASLGGTWKAILSGVAETDWAVNRVGYNWSELQLVDGTTVAYAPNLFGTLLSPIVKTEFGATKASARVFSGTNSDGGSYSGVSDLSNLYNWTGASCSATYMQGNSSALSAVTTQGYWLCQSDGALFCIEQ